MKRQTKKRHKEKERHEKKKQRNRNKYLKILLRKFEPITLSWIAHLIVIKNGIKWNNQLWNEYCKSLKMPEPVDELEQIIASNRPLQNWPVNFSGRDELIMRKFGPITDNRVWNRTDNTKAMEISARRLSVMRDFDYLNFYRRGMWTL